MYPSSDVSNFRIDPRQPPISLFSELSAVASRIVIGLIHITLSFQDEVGRKSNISENTCHDLMLRTPTCWARTGAPDFNFIPIGNDPISVWVQYMEQEIPERFSNHPVPSAPGSIVQEYKAIKKGQFGEIPIKDVARSVEMGNQFQDRLTEEFRQECAQHGIDPDNYSSEDFLSAASFPLAPVLPPKLSPFDTEFLNSNVWGQAALFMKRLDTEKLRIQLLMNSCSKRGTWLDQILNELREKCEVLATLEEQLDRPYHELSRKEDEVLDMQDRVEVAESNPTFASFLQRTQEIQCIQQPYRSTSMYASVTLNANKVEFRIVGRPQISRLP